MAKYQLQANQSESIRHTGRFFRIFSSATDLEVRIIGQGREYFYGTLASGVGLDFSDKSEYPAPFDQIFITSDTAQQVDLWHSLAKADDDRLSGNFDINAALTVAQSAAKQHAVSKQDINAQTEVLPRRAGRKQALIQTNGEVYVQSTDGVALSGLFSWENESELTLIPVSGEVEVRINEDFN